MYFICIFGGKNTQLK